MCGIAGIFAHGTSAPAIDEAELLRMRERMRLRGPDSAGMWCSLDHCVGLAHRRLAIIDLSPNAAQPMVDPSGRYHVVFNGEIYNFQDLRKDLLAQGATFHSVSDTEVLIHLYARHGIGMCRMLRGMYAFAIWDDAEKRMVLARDPLGIKPLYFHDDGQTLRFASQVKALVGAGGVRKDREPAGLIGYLMLGFVPEPWTLYRQVFSLEPGTWLTIAKGTERKVETFESVANLVSEADGVSGLPGGPEEHGLSPGASLRDVLLDSVRHHLISDVPVGVYLSAGIDSATLATLVAESGFPLSTVTLGLEEFRGTPADETVLAERVAACIGSHHNTIWVTRRDFERVNEEFFAAMDQPSADGLNTWLVSRAAAQLGLKVAISGLGGDELFSGYPSFRQVPRIRSLTRPFRGVPALGRLLRRSSDPLLRRFTSRKYAGLFEYGTTWEGAYLLRRAVRMPWELYGLGISADVVEEGLASLATGKSDDRFLEGLGGQGAIVTYLEATRYMRGQLLRDSDWASMAHSIELRVPLLDIEVLKFVARERRGGRGLNKRDLAGTAQPPLPHDVLRRPKTGFGMPLREWVRAIQPGANERGIRDWSRYALNGYERSVG